jgi:hypothetical protein
MESQFMSVNPDEVRRRVEETFKRVEAMQSEALARMTVVDVPVQPTQIQLEPLLYADIEINALRQQVIEKDIALLRVRLEQLLEQKNVLYSKVRALAGVGDETDVVLVDRERRIVEVGIPTKA